MNDEINIRYRCRFWSLYREWDYASWPGASGSQRIFTVNPRFLWQNITLWWYSL